MSEEREKGRKEAVREGGMKMVTITRLSQCKNNYIT